MAGLYKAQFKVLSTIYIVQRALHSSAEVGPDHNVIFFIFFCHKSFKHHWYSRIGEPKLV